MLCILATSLRAQPVINCEKNQLATSDMGNAEFLCTVTFKGYRDEKDLFRVQWKKVP